ncbi:MAG: aldo/keto reductase [Gammaproteobacteria bacterium]|nr:aldo/keto reductase [Gammaproteobacteria bacterium]
MQTRELGQSGIKVAPLAFGGNVFGWTADEATSFTLLDRFVDAGLNLVDTADVYSRWIPGHVGGESETIIGKWLRQSGKRDRVVIATKCAMEMGEGESGLSRAYIMRAVERSLQRLQTDYIDLYQSHRDDENTPQEETLGAYAELIAAGKVRAIGASNFSAARLADALAISARLGLPRYETLQPNYNLYDRAEFEAELGPLCAREKIGVIPYFSLACGFLTGKYRTEADLEGRPRAYRVKEMMNARGMRILAALDEAAAAVKASPAQVALAWLVSHGVTAPIASATSLTQLDELIGSTSLTLPADVVARLDAASGP